MASGYCVRVFLLSLLAFGPHAKALSYRSRGAGIIKPYFDQAEGFSGSHKPDSASPKYESPAQPGGFIGSSGPSYPNTGSFENLKPAGTKGYSGSYGREVDGYSPDGSVSSYRRAKPRDNPQQPSVLQTKAGMWDIAASQNGIGFGSGIASSYGIEMASDHQSETRLQKPSYLDQAQPQPSYPGKPQLQPRSQQPSYPGKPQPRPQRPSYPAQPQPRPQRPSYPAQPQPQATLLSPNPNRGPSGPATLLSPNPNRGPSGPATLLSPNPNRGPSGPATRASPSQATLLNPSLSSPATWANPL
ncbi:PGC-1 and ERR-induced regulator in muscle protein 1-like [Seriola aureovittata]|uniref:PGC-1 and ERR-induced regulator in muscle protein 1-like n=1 Tax=Seriola aureovittata TaxID=2871759 RepID=UPI0024BDEC98|nr:PGC-1 and ERR-induced regulator in muscle protein 1-like [Seriola aureovittata]